MKCDIWLSNEEVKNLERGGFITMKLAEFVLKLISLGVGVQFGCGGAFWTINLRYDVYCIKTTLSTYYLYDTGLSVDDELLIAIKTCAEDLSNLLTVSKIPSNNEAGKRVKVLLSKED